MSRLTSPQKLRALQVPKEAAGGKHMHQVMEDIQRIRAQSEPGDQLSSTVLLCDGQTAVWSNPKGVRRDMTGWSSLTSVHTTK